MQGILVNNRALYIFNDKMDRTTAKNIIRHIFNDIQNYPYPDEALAKEGIKRVTFDNMGINK